MGIPTDMEIPPPVAISDYFLDLVVDGKIDVIHGKLLDVDSKGLKIQGKLPSIRIVPDISKIICCTGYECNLQDFLHEDLSLIHI